jgi:hypothetical protein
VGDVQAQAYEENRMLSQYKNLRVRILLPRQALAEMQDLGPMEVAQGRAGAERAEKVILALIIHSVIPHSRERMDIEGSNSRG